MPLLFPIFQVLSWLLEAYLWVVILRVVMSWLLAFDVINLRNPLARGLHDILMGLTEPVMRPVRRFLPAMGGLDLSPIVVFIAIWLIQSYLWIVYSAINRATGL